MIWMFPVSILNVWEMEKKSVKKMVLKSKTSRDNLTLFTLQLVQARFYLDFRNLKLRSSR